MNDTHSLAAWPPYCDRVTLGRGLRRPRRDGVLQSIKGLAFLALSLWLLGCARPAAPTPLAPSAASAASGARAAPAVAVTILHINDVYEITPLEGGRSGGLARVATVRQSLERRNPNTLFVLAGDFYSPSALGNARVDGEPLAGRQMVAVLNAAGLDLATFGNHEFDLRAQAFYQRLRESQFAYVSSNVLDSLGAAYPGVVPRRILTFPGPEGGRARIGVVAATVDANAQPYVRYRDPVTSIREQVALLRDSVDAIVALTHLSLAQDQALVEAIPEIDLVLGGHEHDNWMLRRGRRFTPILKADANVRSVIIVDLTVVAGGRPQVSPRFLAISDSVPEDSAVAAEVVRWTERAYDGFRLAGFEPGEKVAELPISLDGRETTVRNDSGPLTDLIVQAILREAPEADASVLNGGSIRIDDVVQPGPVSQYDVIRMLPFPNRVVVVELPGELLARLLEQGDANRGTGGFLHHAGIERSGTGWTVEGRPIEPARRYQVAMPEFLVSGREVGLSWLSTATPGIRVAEERRDVRLAVIELLRSRYPPD
ncbi:MAG: bifunctional metallophosphatase/5'-nucleotidase [Gemmatimonadetes bacterium]|nr:bifunctional metallophosphatase/5'-nucleotidase [Gemmatimonadota bacterium]